MAGLPARAVATPWLKAYLKIEPRLQAVAKPKSRCTKAFDCLAHCGLRDGLPGWGQFCIDNQLAAALRSFTLQQGEIARLQTALASINDECVSTGAKLAAALGAKCVLKFHDDSLSVWGRSPVGFIWLE